MRLTVETLSARHLEPVAIAAEERSRWCERSWRSSTCRGGAWGGSRCGRRGSPQHRAAALSDSNAWRGAAFGLLGAVFAIGLPTAYIAWLIRTDGATDRHVPQRKLRPTVQIAVLACLAGRISALTLLGTPAMLVWLLVGEKLLVTACLVIPRFWKISMHSAVAASTVAALVVLLGPWALLAGVAIVLVSWGRVALRGHAVGQVVAGAASGAASLSLLVVVR